MPQSDCAIKTELTKLSNSSSSELTKAVALIILDQGQDDLKCFLSDLLQHGCVSGMVNDLIYYADTHAFYDKHYSDIEQLRQDHELETGQPISVQGDMKNFYAWFAFELTAYHIASDCGW